MDPEGKLGDGHNISSNSIPSGKFHSISGGKPESPGFSNIYAILELT